MLRINVEAKFYSPFTVSPAVFRPRKDGGGEQEFELVFGVKPGLETPEFTITPTAGLISFRGEKGQSSRNGKLILRAAPTRDAIEATSTLVERFTVKEAKSGKLMFSLPFAIRPRMKVIHRPSAVTLKLQGGDCYKGSGILVANSDFLEGLPDEGLIVVHGKKTLASLLTGTFRTTAVTDRVANLEYTFKVKERIQSDVVVSAELATQTGKILCKVDEFLFLGDKGVEE